VVKSNFIFLFSYINWKILKRSIDWYMYYCFTFCICKDIADFINLAIWVGKRVFGHFHIFARDHVYFARIENEIDLGYWKRQWIASEFQDIHVQGPEQIACVMVIRPMTSQIKTSSNTRSLEYVVQSSVRTSTSIT